MKRYHVMSTEQASILNNNSSFSPYAHNSVDVHAHTCHILECIRSLSADTEQACKLKYMFRKIMGLELLGYLINEGLEV
jgi:hypothetical protein